MVRLRLYIFAVFAVLIALTSPGPSGTAAAQGANRFVWGTPTPPYNERWAAGHDTDGAPLYVCRASYNGGVHPGKVVAGKCNITYGGQEIPMERFAVLMGQLANPRLWAPGFSPNNANFPAGVDSDRTTTLYVCRASYNNGLHPGKVVAGKCNIGWGGQEIILTNFEVLQEPNPRGY